MATSSKLTGVAYSNPNGTQRHKLIRKHAKVGRPVHLKREKDNKFDKNAVAVFLEVKGLFTRKLVQIGYIPQHQAGKVSRLIDGGQEITGHIETLYLSPKDDKYPRVGLLLDY